MASGASVNVDILIDVSRKVHEMLISRTSRVTVEVLIKLARLGPQEWISVVKLGRHIPVHGEETSRGFPEFLLTAEKRL